MASNWGSSFFGGLATQVVSDNEQDAKYAQQMKIEQMKKDDDYRKMVINNSMEADREKALVDYRGVQERNNAADKDARTQAENAAKKRTLFGQLSGALNDSKNSNVSSQVNATMPSAPPVQGSPTDASSVSGPTQAATGNSQGLPAQQQTGTPVQGNNPSAPIAGQGETLPNGMADNQAVIPQAPPTASTPQAITQGGAQSPDHPTVTDQTTNNSAANQSITPSASQSMSDKILAANNIVLSDDQKQRIQAATSPQDALNDRDRDIYSSLMVDDKDHKGALDFLKANQNVQAWNIKNGKLADGTPVAPINDNTFSEDRLGLRNPLVNIRAVAADKTQLDAEQNRRNAEFDPSIPKSAVNTLVNAPREAAASELMALNSEEAISSFINAGTGAKEKSAMSKLVSTVMGEPTEVSSANDVMSHFESAMKRNMFSNTKGRVTNQEYATFQGMIVNSGQTPQGRENVINFMKAVNARQLEMANAYEEYGKVNGTYKSADEVINKYQQANPVVSYKDYNPANPQSIFNPLAKSFENWQLERTGKALSSSDHTQTIDPVTQQPLPDSLKAIIYSKNAGQPLNSVPDKDKPALNDAFKQFGL